MFIQQPKKAYFGNAVQFNSVFARFALTLYQLFLPSKVGRVYLVVYLVLSHFSSKGIIRNIALECDSETDDYNKGNFESDSSTSTDYRNK